MAHFVQHRVPMVYLGHSRQGRALYQLEKPILWHSSRDELIVVPAGFVTDGASTPVWSWAFFPPVGKYFSAAALHDYLCVKKEESSRWTHKEFALACQALEVKPWQVAIMYAGVSQLGPRW